MVSVWWRWERKKTGGTNNIDISSEFLSFIKFHIKNRDILLDMLSWQRWSGRSSHAALWHGRTRRAWRWSRCYCPRTRCPPESRLRPSRRQEDHQSHPENTTHHHELWGNRRHEDRENQRAPWGPTDGEITHHARGGPGGSGADHQVGDITAPIITAVGVGQEGQRGLLQQGGGVSRFNTHTHIQLLAEQVSALHCPWWLICVCTWTHLIEVTWLLFKRKVVFEINQQYLLLVFNYQ